MYDRICVLAYTWWVCILWIFVSDFSSSSSDIQLNNYISLVDI